MGFEPTEPGGSAVFKTAAFDRSANYPYHVGLNHFRLHFEQVETVLLFQNFLWNIEQNQRPKLISLILPLLS